MSVVGNLSRHANLAEFTVPRDFPSFQTVATRQAQARANLGLGGGTVVAGTAVASSPMVTNAANGIGGFRDTRATPLFNQGAGGALNATGTLTVALMVGGIVTSTSAAAVTATLDIASLLETNLIGQYPGLANSDAMEFSVVNTGPNTFTIATAAGWTDGGNAFVAVAATSSALFRVRRTGAGTYTIFKVA